VADEGIFAGELTAVPEPTSMSLLLLGAAGLGAYRMRRKKGQPETDSTVEPSNN
jgi:hypothetical protein